MTTIAYRDGVIVGDTQATGDYVFRVKKVARLPGGVLVGYAGGLIQCQAALAWISSGCEGDPPDFSDAQLMMITPDGKIWVAEGALPAYTTSSKFLAIGSGGSIAMGAMAAGASAKRAVQIACELDDGTSAPINSYKLT